jgi:hypothetical protein
MLRSGNHSQELFMTNVLTIGGFPMKSYKPGAPKWWLDEQQRRAARAQDEQARIIAENEAQQTAKQERRARTWAMITAATKWAWRVALVVSAVAVGLFMLLVVSLDVLARPQPRVDRRRR